MTMRPRPAATYGDFRSDATQSGPLCTNLNAMTILDLSLMACDRYDNAAPNMRSLGLAIEAHAASGMNSLIRKTNLAVNIAATGKNPMLGIRFPRDKIAEIRACAASDAVRRMVDMILAKSKPKR
jgi:hypothetical protein